MGISVWGSRVLEVPGRKTGEPRRVPGEPAHVRRPPVPRVAARRGPVGPQRPRQRRPARPAASGSSGRTGPPARSPTPTRSPILRAYLKRWKAEVGVFFDGVGPDSSDDELHAHRTQPPGLRAHRGLNRPTPKSLGSATAAARSLGRPCPFRREHDPSAEDATDALVDGDQPLATGTAIAALRHRDFRVVWAGTFASNIGTWMQNVLLGAFALRPHRRRRRTSGSSSSPSSARCSSSPRSAGRSPTSSTAGSCSSGCSSSRSCSRSCSRCSRRRRSSEQVGDLLLRARDRHRQRAERPGDQRAPPDARAPRGPPRRGVAPVGADEPLAGHRPGDRRAALRRVRRRHRLRPQRGDVRVRDRQPRSSPSTRHAPCGRRPRPGSPASSPGFKIAARRSADPPDPHHDDARSRSSR